METGPLVGAFKIGWCVCTNRFSASVEAQSEQARLAVPHPALGPPRSHSWVCMAKDFTFCMWECLSQQRPDLGVAPMLAENISRVPISIDPMEPQDLGSGSFVCDGMTGPCGACEADGRGQCRPTRSRGMTDPCDNSA
jgi:hypothetical protein